MNPKPALLAPRPTFIRLSPPDKVAALVKEAKRVKYTVKKNGTFSVTVTDPENADALVFKAVLVNPPMWAISYSATYWEEPEPILPPPPLNFAKHLHTQPDPK